jgi:hypothetical protein
MSSLTPEQRHLLIQQIGSLLHRLGTTPDGHAREECNVELRELVRELWIDSGLTE